MREARQSTSAPSPGIWRNLLLGVLALVALARLATVDWSQVLVSNVAEFLPRSSEAGQRAATALRDEQSQLLFFGGAEAPLSVAEARSLEAALATVPGVAEHGVGVTPGEADALGRVMFAHRFTLLFPGWLERARADHAATGGPTPFSPWLAGRAVAELERFLDSPDSLGFEELLADDPLMLLPGALERLSGGELQGGAGSDAVVWVKLAEDPLEVAVQDRLLPAFESVLRAFEADHPGRALAWFGALRYAEETRRSIQREIAVLNVLTALLVVALAGLFLRRPWQLFHLLVPVGFGLATGLSVLTLCFPHIHLLSLVMGSMLAGVAIDYGVHLFFHRPEEGSEGTVIRSLLVSALSTMAGYLVWSGSSLGLARQTGVLVSAGLVGALVAVLLYTPLRRAASPRFEGLLARPLFPFAGWIRAGLAAVALLLAAWGWWGHAWKDSLRILDIRHPVLDAELETVAEQIGPGARAGLVFATGRDFVDAAAHLRALDEAGGSLALLFPTEGELDGAVAFGAQWPQFVAAWREALRARDFEPEAFAGFESALAQRLAGATAGGWRRDVSRSGAELAAALPGPAQALLGEVEGTAWLGAWGVRAEELPPEVHRLSVREDLENWLGEWRREQSRVSLLGVGVIALIVTVFFRGRGLVPILLVPLGSVLTAMGVLAPLMGGLNLFHLAGALLGFCVTLDYGVFFAGSVRAGGRYPISIRFSALTTAVAFAVLLTSQVEAVRSLGATVALSVVLAILGLELIRPLSSKQSV